MKIYLLFTVRWHSDGWLYLTEYRDAYQFKVDVVIDPEWVEVSEDHGYDESLGHDDNKIGYYIKEDELK